jgi:uncharacterized membrane protein YagU involved in acid resistance
MIIFEISFLRLVVAGLIAGYVMAFVGYWMEGFLRLPRVDLTEQAIIYLDDDRPDRWWVGMLVHEVNSVLFALLYAALFDAYWPGWGWLRGLAFGALLWLGVSLVVMIGKVGGAKNFQAMPLTISYLGANLLLHLIYGSVLGALYGLP